MKRYISVDLGATSGRVIIATPRQMPALSADDWEMQEIHRFPNVIVQVGKHYHWNFTQLYQEVLIGLRKAAETGYEFASIGIDTWGVDVVFFDKQGAMLGEPYAYRDPYTEGVPEEFFVHMSRQELYRRTGIQIMNFNTVFQLYAARKEQSPMLRQADKILFIPDALAYLLTGRMVCEYSVLSTSALMDPRTKDFDTEILRVIGVSRELFPAVVMPGTTVGTLLPELSSSTGLGQIPVVAVAGHDTASAVAAVPRMRDGKHTAYLSSGTWSLMGTVTDEPVITEQSEELNFTNEGGVSGTTRLLKNITGMWILEQCRKQWKMQGKDYAYGQIVEMAEQVISDPNNKLFTLLFNPDDPRFANPKDMIAEVCGGRSLTDAEVMATIFCSLARRYGEVFRLLQDLSPWEIGSLYVIGGGARNMLLNRLTEQAVGVPVYVGTTEATALGNVIVQSLNS